jgi:hypothetical protein
VGAKTFKLILSHFADITVVGTQIFVHQNLVVQDSCSSSNTRPVTGVSLFVVHTEVPLPYAQVLAGGQSI